MPSTRRAARVAAAVALAALVSACDETSGSRLHVRSGPSTADQVVATLGPVGTRITIDCFTSGEAVLDNTVWYRISGPERGYVTSSYVRTDTAATTVPAC